MSSNQGPLDLNIATVFPSAPAGRDGWPWAAERAEMKECPPADEDAAWPRITIVTPSFNQGDYLEETIRSVLLQDYPALEYMIIDGGSTDSSIGTISRYRPWLAYSVCEPDEGQSDAILKGFERATGDVLGWLNSDDLLNPGALQAVAREFVAHPEAGLVHGRCSFVDQRGRPISHGAGRDFDLGETIRGNNCVAQPSAFFRRSTYEAVGGLDRSLHYVMDMDLWLRLGLESEIVFVDEVWSQFRRHPESKTGQGELAFEREICDMVSRAFDDLLIPNEIKRERRAILAALSMRLAYRFYQAGDASNARRSALRAVRQHPPSMLTQHLPNLMRCLLGRRAIVALRRNRNAGDA